jgi:hypothetical protein
LGKLDGVLGGGFEQIELQRDELADKIKAC